MPTKTVDDWIKSLGIASDTAQHRSVQDVLRRLPQETDPGRIQSLSDLAVQRARSHEAAAAGRGTPVGETQSIVNEHGVPYEAVEMGYATPEGRSTFLPPATGTATGTATGMPTTAADTLDTTALQDAAQRLGTRGDAPPPQFPDLSALRDAIAQMPGIVSPQADTPRVFSAEDLREAIMRSHVQAPEAMEQQWSPEQIWQRVTEAREYMEPHTQAQSEALQRAYNEAMQRMGDQWAARGTMASGAAMGAERRAAGDHAFQQQMVQAQALEQALENAIRTGQLSMAEAQAIWNQQMTGAQFEAQQRAQQAQQLHGAWTSQEQIRQGEMGLDLQTQQLQQQHHQFGINALRDALGLETQHAQAIANHALALEQQGFARDQAYFAALRDIAGFESDEAWRSAQLALQHMDFSLRESGVTGEYQGQPTVDTQRWAQDFSLREAGVTGEYQGEPTIDARQWAQTFGLQEAQVTGEYQGRPTLQKQQLELAVRSQDWQEAMDKLRHEMALDDQQFNQWLRRQALSIDRARLHQQADHNAFLQAQGVTEAQSREATQQWKAMLLQNKNPEDALNFIIRNASYRDDEPGSPHRGHQVGFIHDGVDIEDLLGAVDHIKARSDAATSDVIWRLHSFDDPKKSFDYINEQAGRLVDRGVDVDAVLGTYRTLWPEHYSAQAQSLREILRSGD